MRRFLAAALVVAAALAGDAAANGRYPATNGIFFGPGDAHSLYVRTTFGLLISHDDGCTFNWVCEQAIGYGGTFDPKYRVGSDGSLYATTMYGLQISHDGGCSFQTTILAGSASGSGTTNEFLDAIDLGPSGEVWVGTTDDAAFNGVYASSDGGATFGLKLSTTTELYKSVLVAPSNAQRVYVTSYDITPGSAASFLYRSDDDGSNWTPEPLPANVALGPTPLVEVFAVDPQTPDTIFVSSIGANAPIGDVLYRSIDGGSSFSEVLRTTTAVHDVAFADEQTVYVTQDPTSDENGTLTPSPAFLSSDGGKSFAMLTGAPELECAASRGDGVVYGCGQNWNPDNKAVAMLSGGAWSDVFRFVQMAGPLACADGASETTQCGPQWSSIQEMFGTTGPTCGSDQQAPDAGVGGGGGGGGGGHTGGGGCETGASGSLWLVGGVIAGALVLRRRRARK